MALSTFHRWSEESHFDSFSGLDSMSYLNESMPTLEDLRQHLNCCLSCGVNWQDDHVSLDCAECGGYSLSRPCPLCEGKCGQQWKRDTAGSHTLGKAKWNGNCTLMSQTQKTTTDLLSCRLYGLTTTS